MEDEIDLRRWVLVLLRQWKTILSITIIAVIVAALLSFLPADAYTARAKIIVPKSGGILPRTTLVDLISSNSVAEAVIASLEDELTPAERQATAILSRIEVKDLGEIVEIRARSADPKEAAVIANAWTKAYIGYISEPGNGFLQSPDTLQNQADIARQEYLQRQQTLENFIGSSNTGQVSRQIIAYEKYLNNLEDDSFASPERLQRAADSAWETYQERQKALEKLTGENRLDILGRRITSLKVLYDAIEFRQQLVATEESPASAAANNLAFVMLQARASTSLGVSIQVLPSDFSTINATLRDIDSLIALLKTRAGVEATPTINGLQQEIDRLRVELEQEQTIHREVESSRDVAWTVYISATNKFITAEIEQAGVGEMPPAAELEEEIRRLKMELERGQAIERELDGARDAAWATYSAAASKVLGAEIAAQVGETTIRIIDTAAVPASPVATHKTMNVVIGLVLGLILGIFAAFVIEYFRAGGKKPA